VKILLVLGLRRDAGKSKVLAEFRDKTGLVGFEVIQYGLHGRDECVNDAPEKAVDSSSSTFSFD
jgi:hypothetical protein